MKKLYSVIIITLTLMMIGNNVNAQLYINEFMASNDFSVAGPMGDYPDWIEIYNAGDEAVDLSGYYLSDDLLDPEKMFQIPATYPDSVTVPAGGFILFYANKEDAVSVLNVNFKLSGGGESIGFWNPEQNFIDSLSYTEQFTDTTYGRYPDGSDFWHIMPNITPGTSNTNPVDLSNLFINEFMASNDFSYAGPMGDYPDWIEIYNAGDEDVMLGGYYLSDDLVDPEKMFQIPATYPDSVTVPAGGFILFHANKEDAVSVTNVNFKLSGGGESVGFWGPDQNFIDSLSYVEQFADTSFGRYPDGSEAWGFMPTSTPGVANNNENLLGVNENVLNVELKQNFPNPFSASTTIEFKLDKNDNVQVQIFDISGSVISVLVDEQLNTGTHQIKWDASHLPAGYYFYKIKTSNGVVSGKAIKL